MAKPNPIIKAWHYMTAWSNNKIDEKADPKIQIQQAIQDAQREHEALSRQAANVIGNQRQLEMKLDRQLEHGREPQVPGASGADSCRQGPRRRRRGQGG